MRSTPALIIGIVLLASLGLMIPLNVALCQSCVGYEQIVKGFAKRLPKNLPESETAYDWWPLQTSPLYHCKVTKARWENEDIWVGKEFILKIVVDTEDSTLFHLAVEGYDSFPYAGLRVKENRIVLIDTSGRRQTEHTFIVFPLFATMLFGDKDYEYHFLKTFVAESSDSLIFAPVCTEFWSVEEEIEEGLFRVEQARPRGLGYDFQKGMGITRWVIPGRHVFKLTLVENEE